MQPNDQPEANPPRKEEGPGRRNTLFTPLLIGLTLALMISLLANLKLYLLMRAYAEQAGDARMDLLSEEKFAADNAALGDPEPDRVRMVIVGDSDVELWEPLPEVSGAQIVPRGFGGDRTGDLLVRLERDVVDLKPAVAVVTIGGNDLEAVAQFPDQEEAILTICERNIRVIVDRLRQRGIHVVLLTILPYGDVDLAQQGLVWSDATYGAVARVNAMIRTLGGPGATVFDGDAVLAQPNGRRKPAYSHDMIHLNSAGYQALNAALVPVLESLAKQEKR